MFKKSNSAYLSLTTNGKRAAKAMKAAVIKAWEIPCVQSRSEGRNWSPHPPLPQLQRLSAEQTSSFSSSIPKSEAFFFRLLNEDDVKQDEETSGPWSCWLKMEPRRMEITPAERKTWKQKGEKAKG